MNCIATLRSLHAPDLEESMYCPSSVAHAARRLLHRQSAEEVHLRHGGQFDKTKWSLNLSFCSGNQSTFDVSRTAVGHDEEIAWCRVS